MSLWYNSRQLFCDFSSKHYPSSSTSRGEDSTAVPKKWNWPTIKRRQTRTQSRNFYWRPRITSKTTDHSIVQAARDFWSSQVQLPSQSRLRLGIRQAAQSFIQSGLENLQGQRWQNLTSYIAGLSSWRKRFFPYLQSKPLLFQLMNIVSHPSTTHCCEKPGSIFLMTSL